MWPYHHLEWQSRTMATNAWKSYNHGRNIKFYDKGIPFSQLNHPTTDSIFFVSLWRTKWKGWNQRTFSKLLIWKQRKCSLCGVNCMMIIRKPMQRACVWNVWAGDIPDKGLIKTKPIQNMWTVSSFAVSSLTLLWLYRTVHVQNIDLLEWPVWFFKTATISSSTFHPLLR